MRPLLFGIAGLLSLPSVLLAQNRLVREMAGQYAQDYLCDSANVASATWRRIRHASPPEEPRIGITACEVLVSNGIPDRRSHGQSEYGEWMYWGWSWEGGVYLAELGRPGPEYGWSVRATSW